MSWRGVETGIETAGGSALLDPTADGLRIGLDGRDWLRRQGRVGAVVARSSLLDTQPSRALTD